MPEVRTAEFIPYSKEQMFELVNDVNAYPQFLPWCSAARVERRLEHGIVATLTVSKGPLQHSFTTENRNTGHERIEMALLEGPFKRFHGVWRFDEMPGHQFHGFTGAHQQGVTVAQIGENMRCRKCSNC